MKKLLAILLCIAMLTALTACGDNEIPETLRGEQSTQKEFALGQTSGLNYENQFIGIGCTLSSDWTFYTDAQIRQLNNQTADLAGDVYEDLMANTNMVYDMWAKNANNTDSINVILEKSTVATVENFDFQKNYELVFPSMKQGFENMGYTDIQYTFQTISLDGKTLSGVLTTANYGYGTMYQKQFAVPCDNGYIATVTVSAFDIDRTDHYISSFYWAE